MEDDYDNILLLTPTLAYRHHMVTMIKINIGLSNSSVYDNGLLLISTKMNGTFRWVYVGGSEIVTTDLLD